MGGAPRVPADIRDLLACALAGAIVLATGLRTCNWTFAAPAAMPQEAAWWKLDDAGARAVDASGRGLHGVISGGATLVQGKRGGALWLGGPESAVSGSGALPAGSSPRTISAWIKPADPPVDTAAIFDYGSDSRDSAANHFALALLPDGKVRFGSGALTSSVTSAGRLRADAWHLVTASYEGPVTNVTRIFVDGKLDSAQKLSAAPDTEPKAKWRIGQFLAGGSTFRGAVDDVRVYRQALGDAQAAALYRCSAEVRDAASYYYLPVHLATTVMEDRRPEDASTSIRNDGKDYAGIQFARPEGDCALASLRGAELGQDLRISVELLVPADAARRITQAGPYFRSRRAAPGDGVIGGTSAGYWVQLLSTGTVKVKRLNPPAVVAFSKPPPGFDPAVFHQLETEARGASLTVRLDGSAVVFDQRGKPVQSVSIPSTWNGPPPVGQNQGTAGIAFGAEDNRTQLGGQQARNVRITQLSR